MKKLLLLLLLVPVLSVATASNNNSINNTIGSTTYPGVFNANDIPFASAANTLGTIAASANSIIAYNGSSVPGATQTLPSAVQSNITAVGAVPNTITGLTAGSNPGAGVLGQTLKCSVAQGSAISAPTGTITNVCSISLTAGVWDVSDVICGLGATTGVAIQGSIATSSGASGTLGDTLVAAPFTSLSNSDICLIVPSARFVESGSATIFDTGELFYSVGTGKVYGRMSATRVG